MDEMTALAPCGYACHVEVGWRLVAEAGCPVHDAPSVVWAAPLPLMRASLAYIVFVTGEVIVTGQSWN